MNHKKKKIKKQEQTEKRKECHMANILVSIGLSCDGIRDIAG